MIVSTTEKIENKSIRAYLGLVTGTDIYLVGGVFGGGLGNQENLYCNALENATQKMIEKATAMNANAIVATKISLVSAVSGNNIVVTITGTAVIAENDNQSNYNEEIPSF